MATAWVERRLSAILAADVVGYSHLVELDEAGTLSALKNLRHDVIEPLLAEHHGRIVKLMGDGAIAEFGSVVDAVACAVAVQKRVAEQQADVPAERRIVFRVGINLGDVVVEGEDLLGDGVNIAARLEQICEPGGVLISGTAYDHLQGKLDVPLGFAGEQRVKNIDRPIRTYRVRLEGTPAKKSRPFAPRIRTLVAAALTLLLALAGVTWWLWPREPVYAGKPSVAVLPFVNLGGSEATGRLADGMTEDIITDLARFPEFKVVARNSTSVYKGQAVDAREVSKALAVGFVLEGSIQRQGERIRITAQLIDGKTGAHVWSERWDRPANDIFAVQTEIAEQVTNRLGGGAGLIQTAGREIARRKRPDNLSAYELYLLGTEKLEQMTRSDIEESIRLLTRAVELEPGLARAWLELSHAQDLLIRFGADRTAASRAAMAAAERAVAFDPSDAEAHAALAMRLGERGELARAKATFNTALNMSPGSAELLTFYSGWASTFGEPERGAEAADQAIRLNPNYPMWSNGFFARSYFMAGRYKDAVRVLDRMPPESYTKGRWVLRSGSYAALNRADEAQATVKQALERFPDLTIEGFISDPAMNDTERQRLIETMRSAGFPPCAKPEELARFVKAVRLPECAQPKTAN
jgi:TolB-like protein/class 3 adenylate cyclase